MRLVWLVAFTLLVSMVGCDRLLGLADYGDGGAAGAGGGGSVGGGGSAGGDGGRGGGEVACGRMALLADAFEGDGPGWEWEEYGDFAEVGGEAVLTGAAMMQSATTRSSRFHYDLIDSALSIELVQPPQFEASFAYLQVESEPGHWLAITAAVLGGQPLLLVEASKGNVFEDLLSIPLDPVQHRFWRIRGSSDRFYVEVAPQADGPWDAVAIRDASLLFPLQALRVTLGLNVDAPSQTERVRFGALNGGASQGAWCKADSLVDDFGDGVQGPEWKDSWFFGCTPSESGELSLQTDGINVPECWYSSSRAYDLSGSILALQLSEANVAMGTSVFFRLARDADNQLRALLLDGVLTVETIVAGETSVSLQPVGGTPPSFWRFREQAGTTYFETSSDGSDWSNSLQLPQGVPLAALGVAFGIAPGGSAAVQTLVIGAVNGP